MTSGAVGVFNNDLVISICNWRTRIYFSLHKLQKYQVRTQNMTLTIFSILLSLRVVIIALFNWCCVSIFDKQTNIVFII